MVSKRIAVSLPEELAEAARIKSDETGVPVSTAIQRLLAEWVITGDLPRPRTQPAAIGTPARKRRATPKA